MTYSSIDNKEQKRRTCPPAWRKVAAGVLFAFALGLGFGAVSGVAGRASPWTALAEISTVRTTPMSTVALCLGRFSKESAGCLEDKKKPCFMSGTCEDLDEDLCHERISGGAARWYAALWNSDGEDPHHAGYCEDRSVNFLPCRWDRFAAVPKCSAQGLSQSGCRNDDDIGQVWDLYTAGHPPGTKRHVSTRGCFADESRRRRGHDVGIPSRPAHASGTAARRIGTRAPATAAPPG